MDSQFKFLKPGEVRVRFAPSPTGFLHIGATRTALFNFLFSRKSNGVFILRIEDTDKERVKPEYEEDIIESLRWLGIEWDEGPDVGGKYGPYRQSERGEIYKKYLEKLLEEGKAYYCFCTPEELETEKQYLLSIGQAPKYSGKCRNLPKELIEKYRKEGRPCVIRFKVPPKKVEFDDLIRGKIEFDMSLSGDFIIAKDFYSPLYNFACVVDDFEMKISHVIRAEEHISNTPKQILLQEALGFPRPFYAHIPLILGPDRSKLSKRHGATSILEYKKQGYLPEALVNFMAFLGWSPRENREFYSMASLIKEFSFERVQKSGAVFNIKKLDFLNGFYIRQKSPEKLTELCIPYFIESELIKPEFKEIEYPPAYGAKEIVPIYKILETGEEIDFETLKKIVEIYQQRLKKLSEISELADFFFKKELKYEKELLKWKEMTEEEVLKAINKLENLLIKIDDWKKEKLEEILMEEARKFSESIGREPGDRGYLLWPLRVALTGKRASAGPFEIAEILGKEKTIERIRKAKNLIKS
jgi:nondiscriminating glutamyl-tRNA synthetase